MWINVFAVVKEGGLGENWSFKEGWCVIIEKYITIKSKARLCLLYTSDHAD